MVLKTLEIVKNAQDNMYAKCGLKIKSFSPESESSEYYAHSFTLENNKNLFRIAKKTPKKPGWFVTIWKRGIDNIITPYDVSNEINFVVVAISDNNNIGEFIFPKNILVQKNIFSQNGKGGKLATRVYTPWDKTTSAQAAKTQKWQNQFFVDLRSPSSESVLKINNLYSI